MCSSKILAFNGSHRSEKGFTEIVLRHFLKGADSGKGEIEVLYPSREKIIPCDSCGKCLFETPGECKIKDDMGSVISKMEASDLLVFASPVYFDGMSSNLKKMIERLRSTLDAYFEFRDGRTFHLRTEKNHKKVVFIFTAGNPERESFVSISRVFNRIIDNMGWELAGEFDFPASHLLAADPERLSRQLSALAASGKEFAQGGTISRDLLEQANHDYIEDPGAALEHMTRTILEMRKENQAKSAAAESLAGE